MFKDHFFVWHSRGRRLDPAWFHQTLQLIVGKWLLRRPQEGGGAGPVDKYLAG